MTCRSRRLMVLFIVPLSLCLAWPTLADPGPGFPFPDGGILFSGERDGIWDLWIWRPGPDGGEVRSLTQTPEAEGNPVYWPQRRCFLAGVQQTDGSFGITALARDGRRLWTVTTASGSLGWPHPSPWDSRILAVREETGGRLTIGWFQAPAAAGNGSTTPSGFIDLPGGPVEGGQAIWLSPDRICYSRPAGQGYDLVERQLETGAERVLVTGGLNWQPAACPSGGEPFFFVRRVGQISSIFSLAFAPDGLPIWENVSQAVRYDWQPSVSPDGKVLLCQSWKDGVFHTRLIDLQGGAIQDLRFPGFRSLFHPTWVPPEALAGTHP